ncbi:hypothetical protein BDK51DRAFT_44354 [Blyttiomyces helicus]|uniref:Uncharacterized protein n=1 Tax=Blyttiomyces helicus TaxID=388810 RepID=A0A4P9WIH2_9FUNG|nr:hypothetical protein BDK51DRAFT_44354 [Blyttiomyces helicus]|eukprot:RKO91683.1 hypothetical protein BDK51DRAFT_44354 [Blyttiomyces helicus]
MLGLPAHSISNHDADLPVGLRSGGKGGGQAGDLGHSLGEIRAGLSASLGGKVQTLQLIFPGVRAKGFSTETNTETVAQVTRLPDLPVTVLLGIAPSLFFPPPPGLGFMCYTNWRPIVQELLVSSSVPEAGVGLLDSPVVHVPIWPKPEKRNEENSDCSSMWDRGSISKAAWRLRREAPIPHPGAGTHTFGSFMRPVFTDQDSNYNLDARRETEGELQTNASGPHLDAGK